MALIDSLKKREEVLFSLTGINNMIVYLKTDKYNSSKQLIMDTANDGILLKRTGTGDNLIEVAYAPGFFISAQLVKEQAVSSTHNRIWEIAE